MPRLETRTKECKRYASRKGVNGGVAGSSLPSPPIERPNCFGKGEVRANGAQHCWCESRRETVGASQTEPNGHAVAGFE